jgi:bla regulator protein blaR1
MSYRCEEGKLVLAGLGLAVVLVASSNLPTAQERGEPSDHPVPSATLALDENTTPPSPIYEPQPPYTEEARRQHIEGTVTLTIVVGPDGSVKDAQLKSKPLAGLEKNALEVVRTWRFRPAMRDGKPVAVQVTVEVSFRLFDHGNGVFVPPKGYTFPPQPQEGVIPPKPIYTPDPEYTANARRAKLEGTVTVEVTIDKKGRVTQAEEVGPKLGMGLDKQAIKAARKWKFDPATRDGKPIVDTGRITLTFKL